MKHIGKVFAYLILAVNAFFVGILLLTAYSPHITAANKTMIIMPGKKRNRMRWTAFSIS